MQADIHAGNVSKSMLWAGRIVSAIPVLMLLFSAVMKILKPPEFAKGFADLGWPESYALALAIIEIGCVIVYLIPRTSILGAILVTGYFGGAIATHARLGDPMLVAPLVLGMLAWFGLYLRDPQLRALIPLRN
jgi:DoxX-like protein